MGLAFIMVILLVFSLPAFAYAQALATDAGPAVEVPMSDKTLSPNAYGINSTTTHTVPAFAFNAINDSPQNNTGPYNRYSPTGTEVEAPLTGIPSGALITAIELQGCDSSATDEVVFILVRVDSDGGFTALSPLYTTGVAATPGCSFFYHTLASPYTVDNYNYTYNVALRSDNTSATSYTAMRVYYQLQVSPEPVTATFSDVPTTHQYFQFIEALADSGITTGYPDGTFRPGSYVTRGQMAVFLAKALGLHWPN
jgi:hypothetical protein